VGVSAPPGWREHRLRQQGWRTVMAFEGTVMAFEGTVMAFEGTVMAFEGTVMAFEGRAHAPF